MATKLQKMKWELHCYKSKKLLLWGLKNGYAAPYDNGLIEKLRTIYHGGIPASIVLLSNGMSNGRCCDRATLLSRAFFDEEDDVQLVYATIDRNHIIYDTSTGFVYSKRLYSMIERPKIRKINSKESIRKFVEEDEDFYPEDIERDKYVAPLILPMIEMTYGKPNELYSQLGIELLQREIEHYKNKIKYDEVVEEINEDMKKIGLIKKFD